MANAIMLNTFNGSDYSGWEKVFDAIVTAAITTTTDAENYVKKYQLENSSMYEFRFINNGSTSDYSGVCIFVTYNGSKIFVRKANATMTVSTSWTFSVTVGTAVEIYKRSE